MHARAWLGLEPAGECRWRLPVVPGISTGGNFLFGGCALGAAVEALERSSGRPAVWATAQYLSHARPPSVVDIDVRLAVVGRSVTQARAVGRVGDEEIFTVNAALGQRPLEARGSWAVPPEVPDVDDCPARQLFDRHRGTVLERLDSRLARGRQPDELGGDQGDGRSALWVRLPDLTEVSAGSLAILGDYVPFGIGQALGERAGGNSLDNTLRVVQLVPTHWVLLDIRIHAIDNGFGHGLVHLWSEDRRLLGTASQSAIVRFWDDRPARPSRAEKPPTTGGPDE